MALEYDGDGTVPKVHRRDLKDSNIKHQKERKRRRRGRKMRMRMRRTRTKNRKLINIF